MSYIITYTQKHMDPLDPHPEEIDIHDIAHALSLLCRGNGQVKTFFSVAQHCIYCALEAEKRGYSPSVILGCLLHDGSEAYMADVPRPLKLSMIEYQKAENRLLDMIYHKFINKPLSEKELMQIKEIDDDLLYFDLTELLNEKPNREKPLMHVHIDHTFTSFEDVEKQYLMLYEKWKQ